MSKFLLSFFLALVLMPMVFANEGKKVSPTVRQVLAENNAVDNSLPDYFLNSKVELKDPKDHFVRIGYHINPSAEMLYIFSKDHKLVARLEGWELAVLSGEKIVYRENEVHFAPTHSATLSIYDPFKREQYEIYPPSSSQAVRKDFTERVAHSYRLLGKDWFMKHNYPDDPSKFDADIVGDLKMDKSQTTISFEVQYGSTAPESPTHFVKNVTVICVPNNTNQHLECIEKTK